MDPEDYNVSRLYDSAYYSDYYADSLKGARVSVHHASPPGAVGASYTSYSSPTVTSYPAVVTKGSISFDDDAPSDEERLATTVDMSQLLDLVCPICEAPIEAGMSYRSGSNEYFFKIVSKSCDCPVISFIE